MTKTMMRDVVMAAASLFAASGCGSVLAADDGTGDGSEADEMVDTSCMAASDCNDGTACDVGSHACVADVLTLEESDFVNDGLRWWSATSGPVLRGKYQGGADAVVHVKIGAGAPLLATIDGTRWTVLLPSGTITGNDTLVSVTMTDPARGGVVELEVLMALDSAAPVIGLGTSKVRDEAGDLVDFTSGAPVHNHAGAEIDLGVGCPVVRKYSYLMDTHAPAYGSELTPNPITYAVTLTDTKLAAADVRVRDAQGTVLRDWMPIAGSGTAYPVTLYRDGATGIGDLAMTAGKYTIDVRARDWGGLEANQSYCIDFQPLAAPLQFMTPTIPTDAGALIGWKLPSNSPVSRITNPGVGAAIFEQRITQYSSEPVAIALSAPGLSGTWRAQWATGYLRSTWSRQSYPCGSGGCGVMQPVWSSGNGALTSVTTSAQLLDSAGNVVPASLGGYVIPGRAAGAPAAEYRVRVTVSNVTHFGSTTSHEFGERAYNSLVYTGTLSGGTYEGCVQTDAWGANCTATGVYVLTKALKSVGLSLNPTTINLKVAPVQGGSFVTPTHVPASMFVSPALDWDGGTATTF